MRKSTQGGASQEKWIYATRPSADQAFQESSVQFLTLRNLRELSVGGSEGKKYRAFALVQNQEQIVIVKELGRNKKVLEVELKNTMKVYAFLNKHGFLAPQALGYYLVESLSRGRKKVYRLILTDLTEGGTKLLWGYSTKMKKAQLRELWEMQLNEQDVSALYRSAMQVAQKATDLKLTIPWFSYHVLKSADVNASLDLCLLDAGGHFVQDSVYHGDRLSRVNQENVQKFMKQLLACLCLDPRLKRNEKNHLRSLRFI